MSYLGRLASQVEQTGDDVRPASGSGSPIVEFDQRLTLPGFENLLSPAPAGADSGAPEKPEGALSTPPPSPRPEQAPRAAAAAPFAKPSAGSAGAVSAPVRAQEPIRRSAVPSSGMPPSHAFRPPVPPIPPGTLTEAPLDAPAPWPMPGGDITRRAEGPVATPDAIGAEAIQVVEHRIPPPGFAPDAAAGDPDVLMITPPTVDLPVSPVREAPEFEPVMPEEGAFRRGEDSPDETLVPQAGAAAPWAREGQEFAGEEIDTGAWFEEVSASRHGTQVIVDRIDVEIAPPAPPPRAAGDAKRGGPPPTAGSVSKIGPLPRHRSQARFTMRHR